MNGDSGGGIVNRIVTLGKFTALIPLRQPEGDTRSETSFGMEYTYDLFVDPHQSFLSIRVRREDSGCWIEV